MAKKNGTIIYDIIKKMNAQQPDLFSTVEKMRKNIADNYDSLKSSGCFIEPGSNREVELSLRDAEENLIFRSFFGEDAVRSGSFGELASVVTYWVALSEWQRYKEVYSFSKEISDVIMDSSTDNFPVAAFSGIPFPSIYIEVEKFGLFDGFLAEIVPGSRDVPNQLLLIFLKNEGNDVAYETWHLPLNCSSIRESIEACIKKSNQSLEAFGHDRVTEFSSYEKIEKAISLLAYLCCENAEIRESNETISVRSGKPRNISSPKFDSIRKWEVGAEITRTIRAGKRNPVYEPLPEPGSGSPKRPHMRRGHYSHYWVGKKDGSEERKLIVRWISPLFVNADGSAELPYHKTRIKG